ncbi:hypothetical protein D3C81_1708090 [compost metagenome]
MSTSCRSETLTRPLARSMKPGIERTCTGSGSSISRISRRRAREADGIARRISSAPVSSIICWMCRGRYTGSPAITRRARLRSSSMKATGRMVRSMRSALAIWLPAMPAP